MFELRGELPGPTGERNSFNLVGRGLALCLGDESGSPTTLALQALGALAAGNAVRLAADAAPTWLTDWVDSLHRAGLSTGLLDWVQLPAPAQLTRMGGLSLVLADGGSDWLRPWRRALAGRAGPRVPTVSLREGPQRLVHERVTSVDTTASGGNTTLLSLGG